MRKWWIALCLMLLPTIILANEWGTLHVPPEEVLDHIANRWPAYELEDYCVIEDTPKGDYGFALLKSSDERLLVGYREEGGKMKYWLKNAGAVPQCKNPAYFTVSRKGGVYWDMVEELDVISDGLRFSVYVHDDNRETTEQSVTYQWKDGGFHLEDYAYDIQFHAYVREGFLFFWNLSNGVDGRIYGEVQTDIRYVRYNTLPKKIDEARKKLTVAPDLPRGGFYPTEIKFTGGQKYPVYTGPGEEYARSGNGKGMVSTNDWIQVLGSYGDWIMIQYDISAEQYRIGWITKDALPKDAEVMELAIGPVLMQTYAQDVVETCSLTDDPFNSRKEIVRLEKGTPLKELVYDYEGWSYIIVEVNGELIGGFVPTESISHG